jgi:hypothetical protein
MNEAQRLHLRLIDALKDGDREGVRFALGDPSDWANGHDALLHVHVLAHAIFHAPLKFIVTLIDEGANPNYEAADGFPSLLAALDAQRADRLRLLGVLLRSGADPAQRGNSNYTALHVAAGRGDIEAVELLLLHGADPYARTCIDDLETPLEVARRAGALEVVALIEAAQRDRN